jgi:hypothetical protein
MIYQANYQFLTERLEMIEDEQVDWGAWHARTGRWHRTRLLRIGITECG